MVLGGMFRKETAQMHAASMHATDAPEAGDRLEGGAWRFVAPSSRPIL